VILNLRKKFILINMSLVSLVLIIVFAAISISSYQRLKDESFRTMEKVVSGDMGKPFPLLDIGDRKPEKHGPLIPMFFAVLDENNEIVFIGKENVTVSDAMVESVIKRALDSGKNEGILLDIKLRYLWRKTPSGINIAFADMEREFDSITNMSVTLILVGMGGLAAFFFISLFLSSWVLRPVEKAWEQQRQFVADASHELKTPITVILANTGILLSRRQDTIQSQSKWIENTQAEASRMKKLVDDLLFLAKSDSSGGSQLVKASVNLSDSLWSCILTFEPIAYEQGVSVDSDISPGISIMGNEGQLKQLIMILLDNACKYAGHEGSVSAGLGRVDDQILLSVNNTGEPIPAEHLDHIFERFYRADSSRARREGGYGLGLSIARTIAENHNASISVKSSAESGTTFTVCFPSK